MSDKKNTGGPAFPFVGKESVTGVHPLDGTPAPVVVDAFYQGMTLRDYFAAMAMAAILNGSETSIGMGRLSAEESDIGDPDMLAENAYQIAESMLKAREQ